MRIFRLLLLVTGLVASHPAARAADVEEDIRDVLMNQTDAWNRGNVEAFVKPYAEDCIYIGKQVLKGRNELLAHYKSSYSTVAAMGKLTFRNLQVREAGEHIALVTGEWQLERSASAGGATGGVFSLVLKDIDDEWRILLDHTS